MIIGFDAFFEAVWDRSPYPWQTELSRVVREEGWPDVLDLPTGSGKTAVLDIALHHLAVDGGYTAPRRIVMVVDRRIVVDHVGARARRLLEALQEPRAGDASDPTLASIRNALRSIVGEGAPLLHTEVLRGGVVRHDAWATYPHVPLLAGSTVDQVGSRLFFRGYGVSEGMRPVHAGLLGCDTLLLLDEVHLARPFAEVLTQLERLRERERCDGIPRRFRAVQLSATPGTSMLRAAQVPSALTVEGGHERPDAASEALVPRTVFRLLDADRTHPVLARVLGAPKPATLDLVEVKARSGEEVKRRTVAERAAHHAREMILEGRHAVAIVVNRVDTARRAWALLQNPAFDTQLLTGRMRPLDQAAAIARIEGRVLADRTRDPAARPIIVVATQCIEAGADYDFDGLVTECASLDALRQRFGRLDRRGEHAAPSGGSPSVRAVILMRSDRLGSATDPIYGAAISTTWNWLTSLAGGGSVDFGIEAVQPHLDALGAGIEPMLAPRRTAPVLLPAYLDQWAQTQPRPHADPDVALFLHGIPEDARAMLPDVRVVWRVDVDESDFNSETSVAQEGLAEHLAIVPPGSLEAISLPVWTVRRWLAGEEPQPEDDDVADVEGVPGPADVAVGTGRRALAWRGPGRVEVVDAHGITPGVTIVVPASRGGIGEHGTFDPGAVGPVADLGDLVQLRQRGSPTLRLDPRVLRPLTGAVGLPDGLGLSHDEEQDTVAVLQEVLQILREETRDDGPPWLVEVLDAVGSRPRFVASPRGGWIALGRRASVRVAGHVTTGRTPGSMADEASLLDTVADGGTESESFTGGASLTTLDEHLAGVAELAERFARQLHLPSDVVASVRWAGRLHDIGKRDPRFQLWLNGGDEIAARFSEAIAKSPIPWQDAVARRAARRRARYPEGQRHELVSLDLIECSEALRARVERDGGDWELVLHLVAAHHGWCRPLAPILDLAGDPGDAVTCDVDGVELSGSTAHERDRLDSGVAARFWRMNRRFGRHELAYCEAILRLADHRRSEWEAAR
jgi:CRISPR-associated endonuclease/helicase Cas3